MHYLRAAIIQQWYMVCVIREVWKFYFFDLRDNSRWANQTAQHADGTDKHGSGMYWDEFKHTSWKTIKGTHSLNPPDTLVLVWAHKKLKM